METHVDKAAGIHNRTKFAYDKAGNLVEITDKQGHKTKIEYDEMDRLVRNPIIVRFTQAETPNNYNQNIKWGTEKFDQHIDIITIYHPEWVNFMNLLISNLKDLMTVTGYTIKSRYPNPELNYLFSCFDFIKTYESQISKMLEIKPENLSYSKYYWYVKFKNKYEAIYGFDAGIEQQQFKLLEEFDQRFDNIHWDLLGKTDNNKL